MRIDQWIEIEAFCEHHDIEFSFINALQEVGLLQIVTVEERLVIPTENLAEVEKMIRLHYDLGINLEGIDVVFNLLHKLQMMQIEINSLRNRLSLYEEV